MNINKFLVLLIIVSFVILGITLKNRADLINQTIKNQEVEKNISSASTVRDTENKIKTHTIKEGDTLWDIAEKEYGSGFKYLEIIKKNPGKTFKFADGREGLIYPGTTLNL